MRDFFENFKYENRDMPRSTKVIYGTLAVLLLVFLMGRLIKTPTILIMIGVLMISIILHELAHGVVAYLNGDSTAKVMGRLTLNPIKHIDPLGMLLPIGLILMGSSFVIGWAKPVPVDYRNFRRGELSVFMVSIAGVVVNFTLAFVGATIIKFFPELYMSNDIVHMAIGYLIRINLVLGIFNILPIPPLDGSKILWSLGGDVIKDMVENLDRYGFFIIIALSYLGILWKIIDPMFGFLVNILNMYIRQG
ncbi:MULTISPECIES: site-2 protease family protein [Psychrilyobacter]|uniref:Site-2 protease family protein n=1 Tax=Psychrilyobacter piezotolerans TaxID=2293438 RepID=A0ABX9KL51_9FUSO|nr:MULTISPECIES: site-2 protease family protein [Psychrilyobacter]MCS5423022.1 site-2 protease family protein [Psychrilyobacter sp. S5]NDI76513.1 site-2 protease family protein [Psychrilyobacter piezotolerans]RDE66104.1 site-2 protease family protein [Psychrilyobacter sp. S5]REI43282.1 site-2 protease family protein [Psychrilyobacter piezotolerans]